MNIYHHHRFVKNGEGVGQLEIWFVV